jgi:hypothetical protein
LIENNIPLHSNNNMIKKTTLLFFFLILAMVLPTPLSGITGPVLGVGIHGGVALTDHPDEFFTPKAQAVGAVTALLDIPLFSSLSLGVGLQLHSAMASSLSGGWRYRSHWGGGLRLSAGGGLQLSSASRPLQLELGASVGGSFNFDLYTWTTLFFYYPGVFFEPYLEFYNQKRAKHSFSLVLPIDYYFRKDLDFSGAIGIGVVWRYYSKGRK